MKKYKSSKTTGNETEAIIEQWLIQAGIPYKREDTMRNTRTRNKGSIDFVGDNFAIEVKKYTKLLTFKLGSNTHDLHWQQIEYLNKEYIKGKVAGIVITEDNKEFIFIHIRDFLFWWANTTRKSINRDIALDIGRVIVDMRWLYDPI